MNQEETSVKHSGFEMLVVVRPLLVGRFALGVGFRLLVLLWLSFDFSVHTGNTSFSPIDTIGTAKDTIFFICQIDFFYCKQVCANTDGSAMVLFSTVLVVIALNDLNVFSVILR
jgi:hypothetical protein